MFAAIFLLVIAGGGFLAGLSYSRLAERMKMFVWYNLSPGSSCTFFADADHNLLEIISLLKARSASRSLSGSIAA